MNKAFLLIITFLMVSISYSQMEPKEMVAKFFQEFKSQGASIALDNLYATNLWMQRSQDAVTKLKSQMEGLNEDFVGKYYGYELIAEKQLTESFILISYIAKFDRQPIRFTFQFYKPKTDWRVHSFKYDGNIGTEVEEAAKLYYLNLD